MAFTYDSLFKLSNVAILAVCISGVALMSALAASLTVFRTKVFPTKSASQVAPTLLPGLLVPTAMILAALAADVFHADETARAAVESEAIAVKRVIHLAERMAPDTGVHIKALARDYAKSVVEDEWPLMGNKVGKPHSSQKTTQALDVLDDAIQKAQLDKNKELVIEGNDLARYSNHLEEARDQRLQISKYRVDGTKWTTLIVLLMVCAYVVAELHRHCKRDAFVALTLYSIAFGMLMFLMVALDRPFTGKTGIQPDHLRAVLVQ